MICDEPVSTPEEAVKTIRAGGELWKSEIEALGMTNVFMPPAEMYEAMQRGVVSCVMLAADNIAVFGLEEVTNGLMLVDAGASAGAQAGFNKDVWDGLPAEVQAIMQDAAAAAMSAFLEHAFDVFKEVIEKMQEAEPEFPNVDALNEVIHEQREGKREQLLGNPPDGIENPQNIHVGRIRGVGTRRRVDRSR
jgi:TRAP-type C4-dicarboxylate transport system substrate-binding protein